MQTSEPCKWVLLFAAESNSCRIDLISWKVFVSSAYMYSSVPSSFQFEENWELLWLWQGISHACVDHVRWCKDNGAVHRPLCCPPALTAQSQKSLHTADSFRREEGWSGWRLTSISWSGARTVHRECRSFRGSLRVSCKRFFNFRRPLDFRGQSWLIDLVLLMKLGWFLCWLCNRWPRSYSTLITVDWDFLTGNWPECTSSLNPVIDDHVVVVVFFF